MLHSFTDLADAVDSITRDKSPTTSTPLSSDITKVLDRLGEIEKQIYRIQSARQPHPPRQPTWADIAANPLPPTAAVPRGRAVTIRPIGDNYKGKDAKDILGDIKKDLPRAVGVRPLRSGDIRVVLKDTSAKERAVLKGSVGSARVLRQDYPVEVSGVPLQIKVHYGKEAEARNAPLIKEILQDNRYITPHTITRVSWIHGGRTEKAGKKRSSLIVYLSSEDRRDKVIQEGIAIKGIWYATKLWSPALQTPRCFHCNRWSHTQSTCATQPSCGHCAGKHDTKNCHQPTKAHCSNCGRAHKAWNRGECVVYKVAKESAARLRYALLTETARIQAERKQNTSGSHPLAATPLPPASLPPRQGPGRPTDLAKAGAAADQRPLPWHRSAAKVDKDAMEE